MYSEAYTDSFKTSDELIDFGDKKHHRINHSNNEFAKDKHINGIGNLLPIAKTSLSKYRGISRLYLTECESRLNH